MKQRGGAEGLQVGGARFPEPTDVGFGAGFEARKPEWITALLESKFMPTAFTRQMRYEHDASAVAPAPAAAAAAAAAPSAAVPKRARRGASPAAAAAAPAAPLPDGAPTKEEVMADYFAGIESDKVFTIALDLIRNKVLASLKAGTSPVVVDPSSNPMLDDKFIVANKVAINAMKDNMMLYMRDAERIVQLNTDTAYDKDLGFTKLQLICGDSGGVSPSLTDFLLNPGRASDIFMIALANLYKAYSENPEIVQNTDEYAHDCEVYTQTLALQMTGYRVRDGFYTNQGILSFNNEFDSEIGGSFWTEFAAALKEPLPSPLTFTMNDSWGFLAARIFQYHKANPSTDILSLFTNTCPPVTVASADVLTSIDAAGERAAAALAAKKAVYDELPVGKGSRSATGEEKAQANAKQTALLEVSAAKKALTILKRQYESVKDQIRMNMPEPLYDDVPVRGTTLKAILCDIYEHQLQFILRVSYAIKQVGAGTPTPAAPPAAGGTP